MSPTSRLHIRILNPTPRAMLFLQRLEDAVKGMEHEIEVVRVPASPSSPAANPGATTSAVVSERSTKTKVQRHRSDQGSELKSKKEVQDTDGHDQMKVFPPSPPATPVAEKGRPTW
ncbi:hypothetical protein LTR62_000535 [Meristemomyces frigidus]|uniref:Uncharacterized protein n=1 Tax=Meristemomyces frigidus TaxID=1508187 RepID=A0AAN7THN5_9PEZI|nr:hypothetical protein LTR62_000535 [Meristemomyces frigidus]